MRKTMLKPIVIDLECFAELAKRAKPYESPNATLRRIFRLPKGRPRGRPKGSTKKAV